ncbi:MAG: ribosomal protein S18-alanine N-acetyltransferase [Actinomycetota bacterium]|nr:ribosomal protein S18-alanine N-acetyltransferase [Actinomycetota bacterium]
MIREAALTDLGALSAIESACFAGDAWSPALVESELLGESRSVLLAADEDSAIGYCSVSVVDGVADLQRIAVLPDARRQGLGRELLEELLAKATGLGATRILLEVAASNEAAIGLYESFGFEPIHRRRRYYPDGDDALVMERALGEWI